MVGLDLETEGKGKQHRSPKSTFAVGINHSTKYPRHKGYCHHLGVMANLDNLHVI